jgi:hypothetical protein
VSDDLFDHALVGDGLAEYWSGIVPDGSNWHNRLRSRWLGSMHVSRTRSSKARSYKPTAGNGIAKAT